jgi:predicted RNA-binding Zn-ribbon protein involved in translation (DUF1610 family)
MGSKVWKPDMIDKKIFISCPVTAVPVSTGFRAPLGTNITALKRVTMRHCPACGEEHIWNGDDGYWVEEVSEPSRWERFLNIWRRPKRA